MDDQNTNQPRSVLSRIGNWLKLKKEQPEQANQKTETESTYGKSNRQQSTQTAGTREIQQAGRPNQTKQQEPVTKASQDRQDATARPERPHRNRPHAKRPGGRRRPVADKPVARKPPARQTTATKDKPVDKPQPPKAGATRQHKEPAAGKTSPKVIKLLINRDEPEECRIALIEDGRVESFHVETIVHTQTKGNIYKGRITAVEPNLQAAFVDIGTEKNAFLPFSDIHPEYYYKEVPPDTHWKDLNINSVIRKGQEVLVQIVKEVTGTKGANVTTYLSLPGRYLVLMPGSDSAGVSKKIESEAQRTRLKKLIKSLTLPEGIGYIIRTASEGITKKAIEDDFQYLLNLWQEIKNKGQTMPSPSLIYEERDVFSRFLRDHFTPDIQEILVDNKEAHEQVMKFLELLPPSQQKTKARLYEGSRPIFNQYQVEKQIEQIYQPSVGLPSGGSIVINPTEALVAIDVNSGRTSKDKSFEETIFLANMEAAEELARQLRLRDLGGLIVVDFIDMRDNRHIREVEKKVKESMKRDKAKVDISRISKFGLMQISRQKLASPIQLGSYRVCEHCQGRGLVQSVETLALVYLRRIQTGVVNRNVVRAECHLPLEAAQYLLNKKRDELAELESRYKVVINIIADPEKAPAAGEIEFIRDQPLEQQEELVRK